jgi:hypothetical protein
MQGQAKSHLKKPFPQLGNPTRHLKLEPITFTLSRGSKQECPEVDFGSFFAMSVPTLLLKKTKPST